MTEPQITEPSVNGTPPPETRPVSRTLLRLIRLIVARHEAEMRRDINEAVEEATREMGFGEGERWDLNVDRGVWTKLP